MKSKRTTTNLFDSVHQQLSMYGLAAAAAGVILLALVPSAEAKIVYTPANVKIGENQQYQLDLNHDGIKDFIVLDSFRTYMSCNSRFQNLFGELDLTPLNGNSVEALPGSPVLASALTKGMYIVPTGHFGGTAIMAKHGEGWRSIPDGGCQPFSYYLGYWVNSQDRYLGLKFMIQGNVHYGWARLSVSSSFPTATLTGYAYETIPGKSIIAGSTQGPDDWNEDDFVPDASLTTPSPDVLQPACLDLGAGGVPLWRRKERREDWELRQEAGNRV